jgi:hypothetical protein
MILLPGLSEPLNACLTLTTDMRANSLRGRVGGLDMTKIEGAMITEAICRRVVRVHAARFALAMAALCAGPLCAEDGVVLTSAMADRFARLALDCVGREYPNKITHEMRGDDDVGPPRTLYPAFHGCFDWHSSVHAHWLLVRLLRHEPQAAFAADARAALARSLTAANLAGELATLRRGSDSFERPYGLAWVLQLGADLRHWDDAQAREWLAALSPLEDEVARRLLRWLPRLTAPIRSGEHSQTAFAFGLALDAARASGHRELEDALVARSREFHRGDTDCPLRYEPSGQDFLSPCLAEADLMRRVLEPHEFARWLRGFLPRVPRRVDADWLAPGVVLDASDGKLAHLDGLNLSRAWMLAAIADALPPADRRVRALRASAARHGRAGLAAVKPDEYAGAHWLGSFATYLLTRESP